MNQTTELPNDVNVRNRNVFNENEVLSMQAMVSNDNVIQYLLYNGRAYYPRDNTTEEPAPPRANATEEQAPEGQIPKKCCDIPTYISIWIPDWVDITSKHLTLIAAIK